MCVCVWGGGGGGGGGRVFESQLNELQTWNEHIQFTSSAELFQHSKGIGQRFHLLKWLSQRANFKGGN